MTRISKVSNEIVNGAGASVNVLEPSTHHSQHSQSSILDLLSPQLLYLLGRTGSPAKWVKPKPTWVTNIGAGELVVGEDRVSVHTAWLYNVGPPSALCPAYEYHLNNEQGGGVCEVLLLPSCVPGWSVEDSKFC